MGNQPQQTKRTKETKQTETTETSKGGEVKRNEQLDRELPSTAPESDQGSDESNDATTN
jgi:hypothetical protein